jgi:hypothetical protein
MRAKIIKFPKSVFEQREKRLLKIILEARLRKKLRQRIELEKKMKKPDPES